MKTNRTILFAFGIILNLTFSSCQKAKQGCYDDQLHERYKKAICTTDCPGIVGCDGNTYCNECEANRRGIRKK